jgi:hypothetical protein
VFVAVTHTPAQQDQLSAQYYASRALHPINALRFALSHQAIAPETQAELGQPSLAATCVVMRGRELYTSRLGQGRLFLYREGSRIKELQVLPSNAADSSSEAVVSRWEERLANDDRLLICAGRLYETVGEMQLEAAMAGENPHEVCQRLAQRLASIRDSTDVTVMVVQVHLDAVAEQLRETQREQALEQREFGMVERETAIDQRYADLDRREKELAEVVSRLASREAVVKQREELAANLESALNERDDLKQQLAQLNRIKTELQSVHAAREKAEKQISELQEQLRNAALQRDTTEQQRQRMMAQVAQASKAHQEVVENSERLASQLQAAEKARVEAERLRVQYETGLKSMILDRDQAVLQRDNLSAQLQDIRRQQSEAQPPGDAARQPPHTAAQAPVSGFNYSFKYNARHAPKNFTQELIITNPTNKNKIYVGLRIYPGRVGPEGYPDMMEMWANAGAWYPAYLFHGDLDVPSTKGSATRKYQLLPIQTTQPLKIELGAGTVLVRVDRVEFADPARDHVTSPNRYFICLEVSFSLAT